MKSALIFLSAVVLAGAIAITQDTPTTSSQTSQSTTTTSSSTTQKTSNDEQNTTIQGCLSSSSMGDNAYTLTQDQTGTVYTLTGKLDDLKSHVAHEVAITGEVTSSSSSATASTSPSTTGNQAGASASSNTGNHSLQVNSVQMISDHCASTGSPGPTGGAGSGTASEPAASSVTKQPAAAETSKFLSLLGMIGLGSLIAGLFSRR
jgi:uncharacterized protein YdeI (BOF family)